MRSVYSRARAEAICARLAAGEPLARICDDPDLPHLRTVGRWRIDHPDFAIAYAAAREAGCEAIAAQCLTIADTPLIGLETVTKIDGRVEERRGDMLGHRKLQIDTRLRLLARWDPRRHASGAAAEFDPDNPTEGPSVNVVISGPDPAS